MRLGLTLLALLGGGDCTSDSLSESATSGIGTGGGEGLNRAGDRGDGGDGGGGGRDGGGGGLNIGELSWGSWGKILSGQTGGTSRNRDRSGHSNTSMSRSRLLTPGESSGPGKPGNPL